MAQIALKNAFLSFYEDLQALVKEKLAWCTHLDLWQNQVASAEDGEEEIVLPAIFVEFGRVDWMQQGMGTLSGDCTVRLHIITHSLFGSSFCEEGADALEFLGFCDELNSEVIQMYSPFYTMPMHTATEHDTNASSVRHTVEEYTVRMAEGREIDTEPITAFKIAKSCVKK